MNLRIRHFFIAAVAFILLASQAKSTEVLAGWSESRGVEKTAFELGNGKGQVKAWGRKTEYRFYFDEFLPALFERTVELEKFDAGCKLRWIFTGDSGGLTVTIDQKEVSVYQRFYDSAAFETKLNDKRLRHPEKRLETMRVGCKGQIKTVTVRLDYKLRVSVELNGSKVLQQQCKLDLSKHQLRLGGEGRVAGNMVRPLAEKAVVKVDSSKRHQRMIGFGGITTPTAYAQLSDEGRKRWWKLLSEYNLLIQREYPIGRRLNRTMDNWDKLEDATPHYYGENFPNGEISDFEYIKKLRALGGKVWFEFWALPPWVGEDAEKYADAMVRYCEVSRDKAGAAPDVVGIQNEKSQSQSMWHEMTLTLRKRLDEAGFRHVKIHMSDAGTLGGGLKRIEAFQSDTKVWAAIDYAATHMYDYQNFFTNPDGYDERLAKWKQLTGDKEFLSTELCINRDQYQWPSYRVALSMGQLYHKNLVLTDAAAICYCWTLLNVVEPSYGWTRSLCVPDKSNGFVPVASSNQLRVFGSYSRRIREGLVRVDAKTDASDLLVSAFAGEDSRGTVVLLNRSTRQREVRIVWPGTRLTEKELTDPYHENQIEVLKARGADVVTVGPGAIVTLTNVALGKVSEGTAR